MAQNSGPTSYMDYVKGIDRLKPEEQPSLLEITTSKSLTMG